MVLLVSVAIVLLFSVFSVVQIMQIKIQKMILITGKSNVSVFEYIVSGNTVRIDYDKLLNTEISFIDYVGLAIVKKADTSEKEWHYIFKTPDELYKNMAFLPGSDLFYCDLLSKFNHVYNAKIQITVENGQVSRLKKNKK